MKFLATGDFIAGLKVIPYREEFNIPECNILQDAISWVEDGCACDRSKWIIENVDKEFPPSPCGDDIRLKDLKVVELPD